MTVSFGKCSEVELLYSGSFMLKSLQKLPVQVLPRFPTIALALPGLLNTANAAVFKIPAFLLENIISLGNEAGRSAVKIKLVKDVGDTSVSAFGTSFQPQQFLLSWVCVCSCVAADKIRATSHFCLSPVPSAYLMALSSAAVATGEVMFNGSKSRE